jgi:hypothetical protein
MAVSAQALLGRALLDDALDVWGRSIAAQPAAGVDQGQPLQAAIVR